MTARVLRPVITLTFVMAILATAVAAYAFMTAGTASANGEDDSTYNPQTTVQLCNALPAGFSSTDPALAGNPNCTDVTTAGSSPNVTTSLIMDGSDLNFSNVVTFAPTSQTINALPVSTKVGGLRSATTLGTFNNPCFTSLTVDFVFFSVALPNNLADPRASTNIVFPRPQGSTNRFDGWQVGSEPSPTGGTAPINSGVGTATGASIMITNYPSHLLNIFDPDFVPGGAGGGNDTDGPMDPLVPNAVYGGLTQVVGQWIPLYFAQFDAGDLVPLGGAYGLMNANMGQPSVSVLTDPSAVKASPSSISDFCTPLEVTTMLLGSPAGARIVQPGSATTQFTLQYNASLRDTDQDGFENAIDTCPVDDNGTANPRSAVGTGDADTDGIPDTCDTAVTPGDSDVEDDGFQNRQDNCPQENNGNSTATPLPPAGEENQLEDEYPNDPADLGPRIDTMGNACDNEEGTITVDQNCGVAASNYGAACTGANLVSITLSDSVANGRYMSATNLVAKCIGGTDADGDGYCSINDSTDNPAAPACSPNCHARHTAWALPAGQTIGGTHPAHQMDTDGDNWSDAAETWLSQCNDDSTTPGITPCSTVNSFGSDPVQPCAQTATGDSEGPLDNWPFDFNDSNNINGTDFLRFGAAFGKTVNQGQVNQGGMTQNAANGIPVHRFDLTFDGVVSGPDLLKFGPVFAATCTAVTGESFSQQ